jgi:hypothetical protein
LPIVTKKKKKKDVFLVSFPYQYRLPTTQKKRADHVLIARARRLKANSESRETTPLSLDMVNKLAKLFTLKMLSAALKYLLFAFFCVFFQH